jgi:hypothetical protein
MSLPFQKPTPIVISHFALGPHPQRPPALALSLAPADRDYFPLGVARAVREITNLRRVYACGITAGSVVDRR